MSFSDLILAGSPISGLRRGGQKVLSQGEDKWLLDWQEKPRECSKLHRDEHPVHCVQHVWGGNEGNQQFASSKNHGFRIFRQSHYDPIKGESQNKGGR